MEETKMTRREKVKQHFKEHKAKYIAGGVGLAVGSVGTYILIKYKGVNGVVDVVNRQGVAVNSPITNNITNVTNLVRRGHAGNIIRCIETGEEFASQNRAAEVFGVSPSTISNNLKGKTTDVHGYTFEKVGDFNSQD